MVFVLAIAALSCSPREEAPASKQKSAPLVLIKPKPRVLTHEFLGACLRGGRADFLAELVARDLRENFTDRAVRLRREKVAVLQKIARLRLGHHLFRRTGIDLVSLASALSRKPKGARLQRASMRRTGKPLPDGTSIASLCAAAERIRGLR